MGGANYTIAVPSNWNGTLVLYSHGYVFADQPLLNPAPDAGDSLTAAALLQSGYALAGSSYSQNGWALQQAFHDQIALLDYFNATCGHPTRTIAWGHSLGGIITAGIAIVMMPWKVLESTQGYIFTWLIGYSALLGPVAGILIVDYYLIRRTELDVDDLYKEDGRYTYSAGWNWVAVTAFVLGVLPNVPGFLNAAFPQSFPDVGDFFKGVYTYAWFVGVAIAAIVYRIGMNGKILRPQVVAAS